MFIEDEFAEVFKSCFPYYLLVVLPIFIIISPVSPVCAAHEYTVHRMHQYDLNGVQRGCRTTGLNLEARSLDNWKTQRHCVVARFEALSSHNIKEILENAGGLLVLLPKNMKELKEDQKLLLMEIEQQLMVDEVEIPVYFLQWSSGMDKIVSDIERGTVADDKTITAWQSILNSLSANGYQIVINDNKPFAKNDAQVISIQGKLSGYGIEEKLPSIAVVAHYDAFGIAPDLSFGGDSNGSGVIMLLELARIFSHLYANTKSHAPMNVLFLLSGGGKFNYLGSKKWLEDQLDGMEGSILQEALFILCLDTVSTHDPLYLHVSKPPKDNSPINVLYNRLRTAGGDVTIVHKKINLAEELLAWEHERYSIRRLPAATLSSLKSYKEFSRGTIFDLGDHVNVTTLANHIEYVATALAHQLYNIDITSQIFSSSLRVEEESVKGWIDFLTSHPRASSVLTDKTNPLIKALQDSMNRYLKDVKVSVQVADKRDPEFVFYDGVRTKVNIYSVKPAIFDLFLTLAITAYLSVLYILIQNFSFIYNILSPGVSRSKKTKAH